MDFDLSEEQQSFQKVLRDFARHEVAPKSAHWDKTHEFPADTVMAMGELGLFGLTVPVENGGAGAGYLAYCLALEEIGSVDMSLGITLEAAVSLGIAPVLHFGNDAQKARWLPELVAGRRVAAFGLTESGSGSDAASTLTRASRDGNEWVIDGSKVFITNAGTPITQHVTITARTGERADGRPAITNLIVPTGTPGFSVGPNYDKLGWRASDTRPLNFDGCRVPVDNQLGEEGQGFRNFARVLDEGRIAIAALSVGVARGCLEEASRYAQERHAFGRPIGTNQGVSFRVADIALAVESARLLTHRAAWLCDQKKPFSYEASLAKLSASEAAASAARSALQVLGSAGYLDESPVARYYRDAKALEIGEGTSEIQRILIARRHLT